MSHKTNVIYVVENGQQEFDLAIPYLDRSHIKVSVNGVIPNFTWVSASRLRLTFPTPDGSIVRIRRETPIDRPLVEFSNQSNLTQEELNRAYLHTLYRQQEQDDFISGSLEAGMVRLGEQLGVVTDPDAIVDEVVRISEIGDAAYARLQASIASIDLNAGRIIDHSLKLTNQAFRMDNLTAVVDALANLEDGTGLATIIQNEAQQRIDGDQALVDTFALIGAKSADNLSFILDLNKLKSSPDETMAQRFNAIYAANADALALIQDEGTARVTAIDAVTQTLQTQGSRIGENQAAIANEATTRATAISAEATARNALSAKIAGDIAAAVLAETNARTTALASEAQARQSLATQMGNNLSAAIQNEASARTTLQSSIAQQFAILGAFRNGQTAFVLDLNRVETSAGTSLGYRLSGIDTSINGVSASVTNEQTARVQGDQALSQSITNVQNTVNGHTGSITTLSQVTNGLNTRYGVSLNSNGHVTGFLMNNNGHSGQFAVVADYFSITAPNGGVPVQPFIVEAGRARFNGNVDIYGDLLVTGSIHNSRLANNTVTSVEAGYNSATIGLNNSTPTRIHGVWIGVEKASSPIDITFNSWATFTHDAGGSFVATVQLVRSRGTDGGTVISSFNINGSGMANDTWQGAIPVMYLDRPNEAGNWHYYVQIYFNVGNMSTQQVTARYGKLVELKNNTSAIGGGTGSGSGVGSGGGSSGGGGTGGGGIGGGGGPGDEMPVIS